MWTGVLDAKYHQKLGVQDAIFDIESLTQEGALEVTRKPQQQQAESVAEASRVHAAASFLLSTYLSTRLLLFLSPPPIPLVTPSPSLSTRHHDSLVATGCHTKYVTRLMACTLPSH